MYCRLYGIASTGKVKEWSISVVSNSSESIIHIEYGFINEKKTLVDKTISNGKNIGKASATTHQQQALLEATSKYNKKINSGYTPHVPVRGIEQVLPMLALDFTNRSKDIQYPSFVQPKLDGVRCIVSIGESGITFMSRTGKLYPKTNLKYIIDGLPSTTDSKNEIILDGEIYSDELPFEVLAGLVKTPKLSKDSSKITYVIYDIIDLKRTYEQRLDFLTKWYNYSISVNSKSNVKLIKTDILNSKEDIMSIHDNYTSKGYEGVIIRNKNGMYLPKYRSKDLQKFKTFKDEEFKIIGFKEGVSSEKGAIVFILESKNKSKDSFSARPSFTLKERRRLYSIGDTLIGKGLTIKYFELTTNGIPRFPIGIAIRDYE